MYSDPTGNITISEQQVVMAMAAILASAIVVTGYKLLIELTAQYNPANDYSNSIGSKLIDGIGQTIDDLSDWVRDEIIQRATPKDTTKNGDDSNIAKEYKKPKSGVSGKEGSKDVPSWAKGKRPFKGESGNEFAKRLMDDKYGPGNYDKGPGSEYNKIRKWGDRSFE